jgi:hypothetical protein
MVSECSIHEREEESIQCSGGKGRRKEPLGRPKCRWEDNIKIRLREIGWGGMDWTHLTEVRDQRRALLNTVMHFRFT